MRRARKGGAGMKPLLKPSPIVHVSKIYLDEEEVKVVREVVSIIESIYSEYGMQAPQGRILVQVMGALLELDRG